MQAWAVAALDLSFPAFCPACASPLGAGRRDPLCGACFTSIVRIAPPVCVQCGLPLYSDGAAVAPRCLRCLTAPPGFHYARSAGLYEGSLRDALQALKFRGKQALARPLADLVLEQKEQLFGDGVDALVPVPLGRRRLHERGYNQAQLLGERLAAALGLPLRARWLIRVRETSPQSELEATQRRANVEGAFAARNAVAGRHVVL